MKHLILNLSVNLVSLTCIGPLLLALLLAACVLRAQTPPSSLSVAWSYPDATITNVQFELWRADLVLVTNTPTWVSNSVWTGWVTNIVSQVSDWQLACVTCDTNALVPGTNLGSLFRVRAVDIATGQCSDWACVRQ